MPEAHIDIVCGLSVEECDRARFEALKLLALLSKPPVGIRRAMLVVSKASGQRVVTSIQSLPEDIDCCGVFILDLSDALGCCPGLEKIVLVSSCLYSWLSWRLGFNRCPKWFLVGASFYAGIHILEEATPGIRQAFMQLLQDASLAGRDELSSWRNEGLPVYRVLLNAVGEKRASIIAAMADASSDINGLARKSRDVLGLIGAAYREVEEAAKRYGLSGNPYELLNLVVREGCKPLGAST